MATKTRTKRSTKSMRRATQKKSTKKAATKKKPPSSQSASKTSAAQDRMVRLLMKLLDCDGETVRRGAVNKGLPRRSKQESTKTYAKAMEDLKKTGALSEEKGVLTLERGMIRDRLLAELTQPGFEFETQLGGKKANVLLALMRELAIAPAAGINGNGNSNGNGQETAIVLEPITSYNDFKSVVMGTFDQLNQDYSLDNLVPIYRIRRELGERVGRSQFNDWIFDIQAEGGIQLTAGELPGITRDQEEDSIEIPGVGFRFYIQKF